MKKILILICLLTAWNVFAGWDTAGTTSAEFLKIVGDAHASGLGGSLVTLDDVNNMAINPAILGRFKKPIVGLNYISFIQGVQYVNPSFIYSLNKMGNVGVSVIYLGTPEIPMTTTSPIAVGSVRGSDLGIQMDYSKNLADFFQNQFFKFVYAGAGLKFIKESFGDGSLIGFLTDFGGYYKYPTKKADLNFAFSLLNLQLYKSSKSSPLPMILKVGAKYDFNAYKLNTRSRDISAIIDFEKSAGMNLGIILGIETRFFDMASWRIGYRFFHDTKRFSTGLGFNYMGFEISYSFVLYSVLGFNNQISLKYNFDIQQPKKIQYGLKKISTEGLNVSYKKICLPGNNQASQFHINLNTAKSLKGWTLTIGDKSFKTTYKIFSGAGAPSSDIDWNNISAQNKLVDSGKYYYKMKVFYVDNTSIETKPRSFKLNFSIPRIIMTADKKRFSPDGDGYEDTVTFFIKSANTANVANWEIHIVNKNDEVVHKIEGEGVPPSKFIWNGLDENKKPIAQASEYKCVVILKDACNFETTSLLPVMLKTDLYLLKDENGEFFIDLTGVVFENDKYNLLPSSLPILDHAIEILQRPALVKKNVAIYGHTDSRGGLQHNMELSDNRAKTVMEYFISNGISSARLSSKGFGPTMPMADNSTSEGRQKNRRVELHLSN